MSGETEKEESGWTTDTLRYHMDQRFEAVWKSFEDLRAMLDERYQTQTKATDAAFAAQQKAMETAFIAADKAVQTALQSAEKAVTKAEAAAEKRFEATNEFRGQLSDQANTFITRTESEAINLRNVERINDLTDRLNRSEGKGAGYTALYGWAVGAVGVLIAAVSLVVALGR